VLVVLLIIGITISMISLTGGRERSYQLRDEVKRLAALVDLAADEAVLAAADHGLMVYEDGYRFYRRGDDGSWAALADDETFRPRSLPPGFLARLSVADEDVLLDPFSLSDTEIKTAPHIVMTLDGEMTPFELELRDRHSGLAGRLAVSFNGEVRISEAER